MDSSDLKKNNKVPKLPAASLIFMEQHYKAGTLSNVKIAESIGRAESFVRKWAKYYGWEKNLHRQVMDEAGRKLARDANPHRESHDVVEADAVDNASDLIVRVVREQRGVLDKARKLAEQFMEELAIISEFPDDMEAIAMLVAAELHPEDIEDQKKKVRAFLKMMNLDGRTKTLTNLAMALSRVIDAERKAFNMDGELGGGGNDGTGLAGVSAEALLSAVRNGVIEQPV